MQKKQNKLPFAASASVFVTEVMVAVVLAFESISESPALLSSPPSSSSPASSCKCYGEKTLKLLKSVARTFAKQLAFKAS
jgi:hypothetical protein